jgi:hypothetical protein
MERRRPRRYDDDMEGAPQKSNATLWIIVAVAGVLVVGGVLAIVLTMGDDPVTPPINMAGGGNEGNGGVPADNSGMTTPEPATYPGNTDPNSGSSGGAQPLTGVGGTGNTGNAGGTSGNTSGTDPVDPTPGGSDPIRDRGSEHGRTSGGRGEEVGADDSLYGKSKMALKPLHLDRLMKDLGHLESTPAEQQSEINKLCALLVDFNAGRAGTDAQHRLMELGKPGVPLIIASFMKAGDLGSREGMTNACFVDDTLRQVVGNPLGMMKLTPMANPGKNQIERTAKAWAIWWYLDGYKLESFDTGDEDDEEEEDE